MSMVTPSPAATAVSTPSARLDGGAAAKQVGDAACGVPAGFGLAAIRVENAHEHIGPARRLHQDQLVAADTAPAVRQAANALCRHGKGDIPGIEHREIIAEAMHLEERRGHRLRFYGPPPADAMGAGQPPRLQGAAQHDCNAPSGGILRPPSSLPGRQRET
jgi:hypothetical protein